MHLTFARFSLPAGVDLWSGDGLSPRSLALPQPDSDQDSIPLFT